MTRTNLTALALALAAITTASLIAGAASAKPIRQIGAGGLIGTTLGTGAGVNQIPPAKQAGGSLIDRALGNGAGIVARFPPPHHLCPSWGCNGYPFPQPKPTPTHGGGDDDHHHRWGWGYGWGHGYGYGAPVVIEGAPAPVAVVAGDEAVPARTSMPTAPVAEAPCNCLSKQDMPDGSIVFQDICAKQSWVVPPQTVGSR